MRTTLKRGVGRATGGNGNGYAALPPVGLTAVSHYRQPRRRGGIPGLVARILFFLLAAFAKLSGDAKGLVQELHVFKLP